MRVGWLADEADMKGGAELTQEEFRNAAPEGIEVVTCSPGFIDETCDRYVIHNCVQYRDLELLPLTGKPTLKFWHDVGPWLQPNVKLWLSEYTTQACCSPIQAEYMGLDDAPCIPPPVDMDRFSRAAEGVNGSRSGAVCVGSWRNYGKAAHKVAEWAAAESTPVDFFGGGPLAPPGCVDVPYDAMPALLAQYEMFVFLPMVIEPFGRVVAEAYAAGCEIVTNGLVGARYWLEHDPRAIETAAADFWELVLSV